MCIMTNYYQCQYIRLYVGTYVYVNDT
jgi:hypothetical protein